MKLTENTKTNIRIIFQEVSHDLPTLALQRKIELTCKLYYQRFKDGCTPESVCISVGIAYSEGRNGNIHPVEPIPEFNDL